MVGIVKITLRRPHTFVVMAVLILIFGMSAAVQTPTDVFPNVNIPVVSVVFSYTGLSPDECLGASPPVANAPSPPGADPENSDGARFHTRSGWHGLY